MRLATVEESRRIDELAQARFALPAELLMEAAGSGAAREIEQVFLPELRRWRIAVVCGPGNNGGDGLVVARHLFSGVAATPRLGVEVFLVAPEDKRSPLFKAGLERCVKQGMRVHDLLASPTQVFAGMDLIIDAVFGIGLKNEVREPYRTVIEAMNAAARGDLTGRQAAGQGSAALQVRATRPGAPPIVSLDCPSGLDCDRGEVLGVAPRASLTITFGLAKPGFFVNDGPAHVGRVRVLGIGFPLELKREIAVSTNAVGEAFVARALPRRSNRSNKTTHGHLAVFAGHPGMWGAALLSCGSAYRMGAGYVTLASFADSSEVLGAMPEILTARADDEAFWSARRWRAAAVGPGLGTGAQTAELIARLKTLDLQGVVLDADGITVAAREKFGPFPRSWVLTPHAGELSRLIGVDSKEIERDRFRYAREAAQLMGCTVVLKGYRTVVASSTPQTAEMALDSEVAMNSSIRSSVILSGNSALAKAGTGDVLTGMIAGLIAQGVAPERAARAGAYLHGRLADEWIKDGNDRRSLQASDLGERLPPLVARITALRTASGRPSGLSQPSDGGPW